MNPSRVFFTQAQAEMERAREKFPGRRAMVAALLEECGELAKAMLDEDHERIRNEAVQVAAMAGRCCLDGDEGLDAYRAERGLPPTGYGAGPVLTAAPDLADALEAMVGCATGTTGDDLDAALEAAEAALRKAGRK